MHDKRELGLVEKPGFFCGTTAANGEPGVFDSCAFGNYSGLLKKVCSIYIITACFKCCFSYLKQNRDQPGVPARFCIIDPFLILVDPFLSL